MGVGCLPTVLATEVSFVVGYASIAWLLRFVAKHSITVFIWYRVALAAVIAVLLGCCPLRTEINQSFCL
jgi:undecaprenyl-diphosphatase